MPGGGHVQEISGVGAKLLWKKAQKKAKKNIISEIINRIIPNFRPLKTNDEWWPCRVDSRTTSRHHWAIVRVIITNPSVKGSVPYA